MWVRDTLTYGQPIPLRCGTLGCEAGRLSSCVFFGGVEGKLTDDTKNCHDGRLEGRREGEGDNGSVIASAGRKAPSKFLRASFLCDIRSFSRISKRWRAGGTQGETSSRPCCFALREVLLTGSKTGGGALKTVCVGYEAGNRIAPCVIVETRRLDVRSSKGEMANPSGG